MPLVDLNKPGEKKKLIWASVLGLVAIIFLWWTFVGFGSSKSSRATVRPTATPTPQRVAAQAPGAGAGAQQASDKGIDLATITPIRFDPSSYEAPEAKRNIFSYYVPPPQPVVTPKPVVTPEPSPPPLLLASISPANAYARAPEFKLDVSGDKFTPAVRIFVDGRELPTKYISPQQLSTTVPASFIANPGPRAASPPRPGCR